MSTINKTNYSPEQWKNFFSQFAYRPSISSFECSKTEALGFILAHLPDMTPDDLETIKQEIHKIEQDRAGEIIV